MNLEEEVEAVVRDAKGRRMSEVADDSPDAVGRSILALTDSLLEGLKFLARRLEALERGD